MAASQNGNGAANNDNVLVRDLISKSCNKIHKYLYFGRLVYNWSNRKYFAFSEDDPDYQVPFEYEDTKGHVLDWSASDPDYPHNWPVAIKRTVQVQLLLSNLLLYMGGPICTPSAEVIKEEFNVSYLVSTLPLCMYILGYGLGQLFCSPMSEQASIGRTPIYIWGGILFTIFQIPCARAENATTLIVCRFISGILASPPMSVGAASFTDVTHLAFMPPMLVIWGISSFLGPTAGPIIAVGLMKNSWRNIYWFLFASVEGVTLLLFFFSPETNHDTLMLWKAQRLRRVTGNPNIIAKCELEFMPLVKVLPSICKRSFEFMLLEPMALLVDLHQAICYGCLYLWFESFPIAFKDTYNFTNTTLAVAYNAINVGVICGAAMYLVIIYRIFTRKILDEKEVKPEVFLDTCLFGSFWVTVSLFFFAWTVNPKIHWIVPLIGAAFYGAGSLMVLQSNLNYLAMLFPKYVASVFGGNGIWRSILGATFPLFAKQMFENLAMKDFPVAWGTSLIGFIFLGLNLVPVIFKKYGPKLQSRSRYSD